MKILITGGAGQLGHCLYDLTQEEYYDHEFVFINHRGLDISDSAMVHNFFLENNDIDFIVNCAAYTNVEGAENDLVGAFNANSKGVANLIAAAEKYDIPFIHISTDYVYDSNEICSEDSTKINPLSIYAQSKRDGEIFVENSSLNKWFIFRTSWLYSEYDGNFVSGILNRAGKFPEMYGSKDEVGSPTYARNLAGFIINFINDHVYENFESGIYNFSNIGYTSRFEFMKEILHGYINLDVYKNKFKDNIFPDISAEAYSKLLNVIPITQEEAYEKFHLKAPRPKSSVLSLSKIRNEYERVTNTSAYCYIYDNLIPWQTALGDCLLRYNKLHIND